MRLEDLKIGTRVIFARLKYPDDESDRDYMEEHNVSFGMHGTVVYIPDCDLVEMIGIRTDEEIDTEDTFDGIVEPGHGLFVYTEELEPESCECVEISESDFADILSIGGIP